MGRVKDLLAADVDNDGAIDAIVLSAAATTTFLGDGNGGFSTGVVSPVPSDSSGIKASDMDVDGDLDLIVVRDSGAQYDVLRNDGAGNFNDGDSIGDEPETIESADFNLDGWKDLVVLDRSTRELNIILNRGDGTFHPPVAYSSTGLLSVLVKDLDGDSYPDIVTIGFLSVSLYLNQGDGTFGTAISVSVPRGGPIYSADLNLDSIPDLIVHHSKDLIVLLGDPNEPDLFSEPAIYSSGYVPIGSGGGAITDLAIADLNGDQYPDLAMTNGIGDSSKVRTLLNQKDGSFAAFYAGDQPRVIRFGDLNSDGIDDFVISAFESEGFRVFMGIEGGGFQPPTEYLMPNRALDLILADINGDGHLDVVNSLWPSDFGGFDVSVGIRFNDGNGEFPTFRHLGNRGEIGGIAAFDSLNDGDLDLVFADYGRDTIGFVFNNSGQSYTFSSFTVDVGNGPFGLDMEDVNGNGHRDIVTSNYLGDFRPFG